MTASAWTFNKAPIGGSSSAGVTTIEGTTFCISDTNGDIEPGRASGLFIRDTRVLSQWRLLIDGTKVDSLDISTDEPSLTTFLGRVPPRAGSADSRALTVRRRRISTNMQESITVHNTGGHPVTHDVRLEISADFADVFEVKEGRDEPPPNPAVREETRTLLTLSASRPGMTHQVRIHSDQPQVAGRPLGWTIHLPPWGSWMVTLTVDADSASPNTDTPGQPTDRATPAPAAPIRRERWPGPDLTT
ncbi:MAG TPA: glycogen debranching N-terminal domain-containing protein, partial [Propionicimonas sp.]|nr:glycogen debranching N-terminal domain-containing protein [Propionicimonas sp.]